MRAPTAPPILAAALLASSLALLPGCLVSGSSNTKVTGEYIGPSTFNEIEPGVTKLDWVQAVMGEPTSRSCLDDGTQIWKWSYHRKHSSSGGVFLLVGGSSKEETMGATYIQLKDDVVIKAWRD
jgi:hypothetical protein